MHWTLETVSVQTKTIYGFVLPQDFAYILLFNDVDVHCLFTQKGNKQTHMSLLCGPGCAAEASARLLHQLPWCVSLALAPPDMLVPPCSQQRGSVTFCMKQKGKWSTVSTCYPCT